MSLLVSYTPLARKSCSSTLLLASAYGVLDPAQLYANVALLAAALWFTYRYFTEVWPNREKVYVPEPWKGD